MPKTIDIMYLVPAAYRGRMVYGNGFAASDNLQPWEEQAIKERLEDCQEFRDAFVDVLHNIAPARGLRAYKTVILVTPARKKTVKNPIRGAGMNARGGWQHTTGSGVWLVKYANGPSFQIVRDGSMYDLDQGRWSTKADSFKSAINLGRYKTLSEAQMAAHSARSRWSLGRRANPTPVSITATYKASDTGVHPVLDQALELANQLKGLPVPYVATRVLQLGGPARASVGLSLSFDPKEAWPNGIFENSRHAKFSVNPEDGTIEQLTGWKVNKFRKARFKSSREALQKLAAWIQTATSTVKSNPHHNPISLTGAESQWKRFADRANSILDDANKTFRTHGSLSHSVFDSVPSYLSSLEECVAVLKAARSKEASAAAAKVRGIKGRLAKFGIKANPAADKPWALSRRSGWDDIVVGMYESREAAEAALKKKARYRPEYGDTPQSVGYMIVKTGKGTSGKGYYNVITIAGKKQLRLNV